MRLAAVAAALSVGTGGFTVTTLPRPGFPTPAAAHSGSHRLVLVSSSVLDVTGGLGVVSRKKSLRGLDLQTTVGNRDLELYGKDGASARLLVAPGRYAFDFVNYAWPPRIVYEQVVWAHEAGGVLYVENAHSTYARSSYERNAYITAIDLKTRKKLWRSPALVANADTFLVTDHYIVTGYGFTAEPDYLYLLDRRTGRVLDRLDLPSSPERITWQGKQIHVRTYDHGVVVRLEGR
jgi:hypothetical protein